jgi:hypothetical protein
MMLECDREQDVLDALSAGRWPDRCDAELRAHVTSCPLCTDLADVATALLDDRDSAWREARVAPSGVVWWRAQLRAREEAARAAGRPLAFIQGVAASFAVWLVVALLRAVPSEYLSAWRAWAAAAIPQVTFTMPDVARLTAAVPLSVLLILGVWLLLAPIAIYFAVADE